MKFERRDIDLGELTAILDPARGLPPRRGRSSWRLTRASPSTREQSGPLMRGLLWWLYEQLELRTVEPNSTLGGALTYLRKHWAKLTVSGGRSGAIRPCTPPSSPN